jgi:hypothetical protein
MLTAQCSVDSGRTDKGRAILVTMKRFNATAVMVVVLAMMLGAQTPAKPNFAGKWAPTDPASAQGMGGLGSLATITQDEKTLKVTATSQMGEIATTYNLDGTEAKSPLEIQGNSIERTTKAKWDGTKLVLTTVANFGGQNFETTQTWALDAAGNLLVESTRPDFQGGGAAITTKATYKKQ